MEHGSQSRKAPTIFFLLFHHYPIPRSILCHITRIRDIKATAIYSSFLTTLSSQRCVYDSAAENENVFMALSASQLFLFLFIREKAACEAKMKKKQETKRENKL